MKYTHFYIIYNVIITSDLHFELSWLKLVGHG